MMFQYQLTHLPCTVHDIQQSKLDSKVIKHWIFNVWEILCSSMYILVYISIYWYIPVHTSMYYHIRHWYYYSYRSTVSWCHLGVRPKKISLDILRYPEIFVNTNKSKDIFYGYFRISLFGYQHGYQGILLLDIKGYLLPSRIYSAISFYIQLVIHRYPIVYPILSYLS